MSETVTLDETVTAADKDDGTDDLPVLDTKNAAAQLGLTTSDQLAESLTTDTTAATTTTTATTATTQEPTEETAEEEEPIVVPEDAKDKDAVKAALQRERDNYKAAKARAKELEDKLKERDLPLEQKVEEAQRTAAAAELKSLRYEVAAEQGVDLSLANRLTGTTREELVADAETLKQLVGSKPRTPVVAPEGGVRTPPAAQTDPTKAHNDFFLELVGAGKGL
jgi:hypothetical protein